MKDEVVAGMILWGFLSLVLVVYALCYRSYAKRLKAKFDALFGAVSTTGEGLEWLNRHNFPRDQHPAIVGSWSTLCSIRDEIKRLQGLAGPGDQVSFVNIVQEISYRAQSSISQLATFDREKELATNRISQLQELIGRTAMKEEQDDKSVAVMAGLIEKAKQAQAAFDDGDYQTVQKILSPPAPPPLFFGNESIK